MINTVTQGGAGSQPVSLGGWVAQIRKDLVISQHYQHGSDRSADFVSWLPETMTAIQNKGKG